MDRITRLTLDTNIFSKGDLAVVAYLIECQNKGILEVRISNIVLAELANITDSVWRDQVLRLARQAEPLPELQNHQLLDQIFVAIFPGVTPDSPKYMKRQKDAVILAQHIQAKGHYFLTRDRHFLQHRDKLWELYKCNIKTPSEIRNYL